MAAGGPWRPVYTAAARMPRLISPSSRWLTRGSGGGALVRSICLDHRNRLSNIWVPAPQVSARDAKQNEESHEKLVRAGFFRQAHSGVFHMLPLGLRVQDKIEALVDKHMKAIGAARVSLSSISSAKLWARSGRLESIKSELFQFSDRKEAAYLLGPTHEEEITELVAQNVQSYRGLPLRLYQITRKYRDEMRPRHGILRSREFVMKDLYSFDATVEDALQTYDHVRGAYARIFAELKVPVLVARASSGDMGGDLSHEYHLAASLGEDDVAHCPQCGFTANTEVVQARLPAAEAQTAMPAAKIWHGVTKDRRRLVNVWYPATAVNGASGAQTELGHDDIDPAVVRLAVPDLDTGVERPLERWVAAAATASSTLATERDAPPPSVINLVDGRLQAFLPALADDADLRAALTSLSPTVPESKASTPSSSTVPESKAAATTITTDSAGTPFNFVKPRTGDACPNCHTAGALQVERAIELGHTFYLGTRYTEALGVQVAGPSAASAITPLMGCYGLGISRILGAVADQRADARGLNWPRAIAPYEVVVVVGGKGVAAAVGEAVYDELAGEEGRTGFDVLLDDRAQATMPWKLKDADLTGYPVVVVVGAAWQRSAQSAETGVVDPDGLCEVQCRQLGVRENVPLKGLRVFVGSLLERL